MGSPVSHTDHLVCMVVVGMGPDVPRKASKVAACWSTEVVVVGTMPTWSRGPIDESQPMRVKKNKKI